MAQYGPSPASEVHLKRYYRNKSGESISEIAARDKVDEATVKNSIHSIELYRQRHNVEVLNEAIVGVVLDVVPRMKKSLARQLEAKTVVDDGNGKKRKEDDFQTQRSAVAEVRGLIQTVQPKAPTVHATQVNANIGAGNTPRLASGSYVGMEDRLKRITDELEIKSTQPEPKKLMMQAPIASIEDGEYEEAEPVESEA